MLHMARSVPLNISAAFRAAARRGWALAWTLGGRTAKVKALQAQPGAPWTDAQIRDVAQVIQRCANWHATPQVTISATRPAKLAAALRRALRDASQESLQE